VNDHAKAKRSRDRWEPFNEFVDAGNDLKPHERCLWFTLFRHAWWKKLDGQWKLIAIVDQGRLARSLCVSRRTIRGTLDSLTTKGFIASRRSGSVKAYRLFVRPRFQRGHP
jgi:hypothetical protein